MKFLTLQIHLFYNITYTSISFFPFNLYKNKRVVEDECNCKYSLVLVLCKTDLQIFFFQFKYTQKVILVLE